MTQQQQPTTPENLLKIEKMFKNICPLIESLYSRWLDESEYEDINDYAEIIKKQLPIGFKLESMTKKPFGFQFSIGTAALYVIKANSKALEWKRIR